MGFDSSTTPFSDTQVEEALDRAATEVDDRTGTHFATATDDTPDFQQVTLEKHTGKGATNLNYFLNKYPLPNVTTTVVGTAVGVGSATIWVQSTNGFLDSGTIVIETNKITYTGKVGSAFTGCSGSIAHGTSKSVSPHVIEISTTDVGFTPTWTVLEPDIDVDVQLKSGRVHLYESSLDSSSSSVAFSRFPAYQVPNRFRATYLHGWETIPKDITRLTLMIASQDLMHSVVRKATGHGRDEFSPALINVDEDWINKTIARYKSVKQQNV